jgi:uncharacterized protein YcfJ
MNTNVVKRTAMVLAIGGVLLAGGAFAAFQGLRGEHADVTEVVPITVREDVVATVLTAVPVTEIVAVPRRICSAVAARDRLPERDGNVGGTVAGAVIGGLLGNQVGRGDGRKLATLAGAVAGGFAGREVDRRHVGGRVVDSTRQRCETISEAREEIVGYDVSYRTQDGEPGTVRLERKPGDSVVIGQADRVVAYNVTYQFGDRGRTVRMDRDPGERLPVVDGAVVLATDDHYVADNGGAR